MYSNTLIQITTLKNLKLEAALKQELDPKTDSLRIYTVCSNCKATSTVLADEPPPFDKEAIYFF